MSQRTRAYIYRISIPVVALLVFYGIIAEGAAALWLGLIGAVLGIGDIALAAKHTPTQVAEPHTDTSGGNK
ncbi:phage holin [Natronoglycomyces albus]|uniref:Uncharacterized protein n=1 Tax=Natronoglycomyces albus TaxID=2811108 RepID=A0A895XF81_9ACTN|nr:hypothetical protein [Natronoglycomyces albus]QSB04501.1 hypothetical protein JQS30_12040 [Natronoglycomyces albus]